jgi:hypothetical protein
MSLTTSFWSTLATRFGPPIKQIWVALFRDGTFSWEEWDAF